MKEIFVDEKMFIMVKGIVATVRLWGGKMLVASMLSFQC